jgi:hypothetical protein
MESKKNMESKKVEVNFINSIEFKNNLSSYNILKLIKYIMDNKILENKNKFNLLVNEFFSKYELVSSLGNLKKGGVRERVEKKLISGESKIIYKEIRGIIFKSKNNFIKLKDIEEI